MVNVILVGGLNPSEKYESQLGWFFPTYGKIKAMFQTTNQDKYFSLNGGELKGSCYVSPSKILLVRRVNHPIWTYLDNDVLPCWRPLTYWLLGIVPLVMKLPSEQGHMLSSKVGMDVELYTMVEWAGWKRNNTKLKGAIVLRFVKHSYLPPSKLSKGWKGVSLQLNGVLQGIG